MKEVSIQELKKECPAPRLQGPQTDRTRLAHERVLEFVESGVDAAEIEWNDIDSDFRKAKGVISARIGVIKNSDPSAEDVGIRSNRDSRKVYLIHKDRVS